METTIAKWMPHYTNSRSAALRLICFPYAGGGANFYRSWSHHLPSTVEVCAIQLPGRESRLLETPCSEIDDLVAEITSVITTVDPPLAFFGHSMGALLAFACAREFYLKHQRSPTRLFVSARRAPHIPPKYTSAWRLPRHRLIQKIRQLDGTTDEVLASDELMDIYMPIIRADFKINETVLEFSEQSRLPCPITALGGSFDPEVSYQELAAWSDYTQAAFSVNIFHGGHFYLRDQPSSFFECLARCLG